ncbi:MAG: DEAD/DEAH box helicase, partial [Kiritimatiellia bacterium]
YHLPDDPAVYTHRSGRTARAGKSGVSIALVTARERARIRLVERICGMRFEQRAIPTAEEIRQKHVFYMAEQVRDVKEINPSIRELLPAIASMVAGLSSEEVLARILQLRLAPLMEDYANAKDLNLTSPTATREERAGRDEAFGDRRRIMVHAGRVDGLREGAIVRIVCEQSGLKSADIGAIDIKQDFAFFDVRSEFGDRVLAALESADFDGRPLEPKFVEATESLHKKSFGGGSSRRPSYGAKSPFPGKSGPRKGNFEKRPSGNKPAFRKDRKGPRA